MAVVLTAESVPRRIVPKLRQLHWLLTRVGSNLTLVQRPPAPWDPGSRTSCFADFCNCHVRRCNYKIRNLVTWENSVIGHGPPSGEDAQEKRAPLGILETTHVSINSANLCLSFYPVCISICLSACLSVILSVCISHISQTFHTIAFALGRYVARVPIMCTVKCGVVSMRAC